MNGEEYGDFYRQCRAEGLSEDDAAALIDGMIAQRARQRKAAQRRAAIEAVAGVVARMMERYERELVRA